jgi:two-component system, chemotaxis family, sensor kinase CheA
MNDQDLETIKMFAEESKEHLADIESDLLAIEDSGVENNEDLVNKIFRSVHSIKGSAGFMGFDNIKALSHELENVMGMIRSGDLVPNSEVINILLDASDKLKELIDNVDQSNDMNIAPQVAAL